MECIFCCTNICLLPALRQIIGSCPHFGAAFQGFNIFQHYAIQPTDERNGMSQKMAEFYHLELLYGDTRVMGRCHMCHIK